MKQFHSYRQAFEDFLISQRYEQEPSNLYAPVNYVMAIGGKRMRPILLLLAYSLYKKDISKAMVAALAIEVFHNFTLIHDDIMDAAPLRRGKASVHIKYGINTGILSGDAMLILAYQLLTQTGQSDKTHDLVTVFSKVALRVCEGQQYDVDFESRPDVRIEEYIEMIEMKTAVLLAGSLEMGAILGEASLEDRQHLYEFGRLSGIAFQIQDDYLDVFGNPEKVGKQAGGDILQNKKTILYLQALAAASNNQKEALQSGYQKVVPPAESAEKIAIVTDIMIALDIPVSVCQLRDQYQQQAYAHLDAVSVASEQKQILKDFTELLLQRDS